MWVNESGLYELLLGCRKPEAQAFKHWVLAEVLPALRKTGCYATGLDEHERALLTVHANQSVLYLGIVGTHDGAELVKYGSSDNIHRRVVKEHKRDMPDFRLKAVIPCRDKDDAEEDFKGHMLIITLVIDFVPSLELKFTPCVPASHQLPHGTPCPWSNAIWNFLVQDLFQRQMNFTDQLLAGDPMKSQVERQVFFNMKAQGHPIGVIAKALTRWSKEGMLRPVRSTPVNQHQYKLSSEMSQQLVQYVSQHNTATLRQMAFWLVQQFGITVTVKTVHNYCRRHNLTHKKACKAYSEMSQERAQQFLQQIAATYGPRTMALDEAAFFYNHVSGYAWSVKGTRAIVKRPGIRGQAHSLLLCISPQGVVKWQLYQGAVRAPAFREFLLELPNDSTLVLDNCRIHHATNVLTRQGLPTVPQTAADKNITLTYLPPYAPKLNPVELCFNAIRIYIGRERPRTQEQLAACISEAVNGLSPSICDRTINKVWFAGECMLLLFSVCW